MVAMVIALVLTSCNVQKCTLFFNDGIITLRTSADLSQNKLDAIQKEIEDVISNKEITAKEIKIAVKKIIKT